MTINQNQKGENGMKELARRETGNGELIISMTKDGMLRVTLGGKIQTAAPYLAQIPAAIASRVPAGFDRIINMGGKSVLIKTDETLIIEAAIKIARAARATAADSRESDFDAVNNEDGEGYNPHRTDKSLPHTTTASWQNNSDLGKRMAEGRD